MCDLPCSELSEGSSDQGEGLVRARKPVLQSWEVVAAGAGRLNDTGFALAAGGTSED